MRCEGLRYRMLRIAGKKMRDLRAPPGKLGRRELRVRGFVDRIVDLAAERIQGGDGAPALGRQEKKRGLSLIS